MGLRILQCSDDLLAGVQRDPDLPEDAMRLAYAAFNTAVKEGSETHFSHGLQSSGVQFCSKSFASAGSFRVPTGCSLKDHPFYGKTHQKMVDLINTSVEVERKSTPTTVGVMMLFLVGSG